MVPPAGTVTVATPSSAASAVATRRAPASITATLSLTATGRQRIRVLSNATRVKVSYRTAKGKARSLTRKLRKGRASITLPAGAGSIRVRAKASARVAGSAWVAVALPVPAAPAPPAVAIPPEPTAVLPTPTPVPVGYDVSWPQCGSTLPIGAAFAIVGVNGGLASTTNPCLAEQLAWASGASGQSAQPPVALYVNTANPPAALASWWPTSDTYPLDSLTPVSNPYGACTGGDSPACSYIYGYAKAYDNVYSRGVPIPAGYFWWLDVETENSWGADTTANRAVLEGMTYYYLDVLHAAGVGIYSTAYQWTQIVGGLGPVVSGTASPRPSNLNGLPSWLAGASTLEGAQAACALPALTGGRVTVTQYVRDGLDHNYACP